MCSTLFKMGGGVGMSETVQWITSLKKQFVAPLICGQILFVQVSTNTSTARPDASKHSRRSDVRARNLHGKTKTSERKVLLILHQKPQQSSAVQQFSAGFMTG